MIVSEKKEREPDWAHRARYIDHKPEWVDGIPDALHSLGEVFFPIPLAKKAHTYPHHIQEYRFDPEDETLNAYIEAGWGYGIVCANNLIVVDIDEKEKVGEVTDDLPESVYQVSGSREGIHIFYRCPGLNTRQIIHIKTEKHDCDREHHSCGYNQDGECDKEYEWEHLGEVKADPHGYVVGPGSKHPSGNKYGPLKGDEITEISKEDLLESLEDYIKPTYNRGYAEGSYDPSEAVVGNRYEFYKLSASDVIPFLTPNNRVDHPVHGSTSDVGNFMLNDDGKTFTCWRHNYGGSQGCGLNAQQFLAQSESKQNSHIGYLECDEIRDRWHQDYRLHYLGWRRAVSDGHIEVTTIPYKVILGYCQYNRIDIEDDDIYGETYWNLQNEIKYELLERDVGAIAHMPDG